MYLMALLDYAFEDIRPEGGGVASALFEVSRPNLDQSKAKANAGAAGGTVSRPKQMPSKPKQAESKPKQPESNKKKKKKEEVEEEGITPLTPLSPPAAVQWAENVTMTNDEHDKLLAAHGPADTARLIEILDNYKGSTGKRYRSDYRAILSWCTDRLEEEKRRGGKQAASKGPGGVSSFSALFAERGDEK